MTQMIQTAMVGDHIKATGEDPTFKVQGFVNAVRT